jgi:hypothetical protein
MADASSKQSLGPEADFENCLKHTGTYGILARELSRLAPACRFMWEYLKSEAFVAPKLSTSDSTFVAYARSDSDSREEITNSKLWRRTSRNRDQEDSGEC